MSAGAPPISKQSILILLIVTTTLLGAGLGFVGVFDSTSPSSSGGISATPAPPTVEATPPAETATSPTETATRTDTPDTDTRSTPTATTSPTATAIAATDTSSPSDDDSSDVTASLSISATDPDDVANAEGHVAGLRGEISGTLSWHGEVDSVVVVVSSWSPHGGWVEKRRTTISPAGDSVTLLDALDRASLLYATDERAAAFDNPDDATRVTRRGYVGVTAVLFDDGEEVGTVSRVAGYSFDVTNAGTVDVVLGSGDDRGTTIGVANAAPGWSGNRTLVVGNNGTASGSVRIFLRNVTGTENGFTDAEAAVDDDSGSELLGSFGLRVAVVSADGRSYVLGSPGAYVTLGTHPDAWIGSFSLPSGDFQRVVVEWRILESAGNDVMSDSVSFDLQFQLVSDGTS